MTKQVITPYQIFAARCPTFTNPQDDANLMGDLILDVKNKQYLLGSLTTGGFRALPIKGNRYVEAFTEYMPVLCSAQEFNEIRP